jgi:hypothetical protein
MVLDAVQNIIAVEVEIENLELMSPGQQPGNQDGAHIAGPARNKDLSYSAHIR